ncbi:hypothetical protein K3495_g12282 [Podosphaera aphanis]|nr:hypothetical protein K3495_g12282 [Podosphaera aphanis]
MSTSIINSENGVNQTTWGRASIYSGINYHEFESTIKNVLEIARVWSIVAGDEKKPIKVAGNASITDADISNWVSRNERSMMIIVGSVDSIHRTIKFRNALAARDAAALWDEVKSFNSSPDGLLNTNVRIEFYEHNFDPDKSTFAEHYAKLVKMQKLLLGTDRPPTDSEILDRIIASIHKLPAEKVNWHGAEYRIRSGKLKLTEAIPVLQEAEKMNPSVPPAATSANFASNSTDNRDRNTKGRGGYRGRGRGGVSKSQDQSRQDTRGRGRYSSSRQEGIFSNGRNNNRNANRFNNENSNSHVGNNSCGFCYQPGHWQKDFAALREARSRYHNPDAKSNDGAHANVASDLSQFNRFDYLSSYERANIVMETALVSNLQDKVCWKIDSGATRHFSGKISDFSGLKRYHRLDKIGTLTLKDVWYVPAFKNISLISVGALNKDGISLKFKDGVATGKKDKEVLFHAQMYNDLYQLIDEDLHRENDSQSSFSARQSGGTAEIQIPIDGMSQTPSNADELWHFRLAHASYRTISRLPEIPR